jgi:hypothetical protein
MTTAVRNILSSFDRLEEPDKRELVREILRRSVLLDSPPLSDEDLVLHADEAFLDLDRQEGKHAGARSR